jgi:hypothetical protein
MSAARESQIQWHAKERRAPLKIRALAGLLLFGYLTAGAGELVPVISSSAALVGDCGDLGRVVFLGNQAFGAEALRRGLEFDLDSAIAIQPDASMSDCLHTLELRLRAGYELAGFPETEVHAEADTGARRILLRIAEGRRCYCGKVRVEGLKTLVEESVSAQILKRIGPWTTTNPLPSLLQGVGETNPAAPVKLLSVPQPGFMVITNRSQVPDTPLATWAAGMPVPMDAAGRGSLAIAVSNAFADLGSFNARFTLDFTPEALATSVSPSLASRRPLDLVVKVQDEGPSCAIGEIEVSPLRKNSRDELLSWLGLASGQRFTRGLLVDKQAQLVDSGRFTMARLEPGTPDPNGKVKLRLVLRELELAPSLSAQLSPEEAALDRLRLWLQDWPNRNEDAVLTLQSHSRAGTDGFSAELIVSPRSGVLVRINKALDTAAAQNWVFYARSNTVALFDSRRREGLRAPANWQGALKLKAALGVNPDGTGNISVAGGITSIKSEPPLNIELQLLPAAFIRLARLPGLHWQNDHGLLAGSSSNSVLQVDARTGRLVEWRCPADDTVESMIALISGISNAEAAVVLQFRTNAFAEAISETIATTSGFTNRYDERHPSSSALAFLAREALHSPLVGKLASTNVTAGVIAAAASTLSKLFDRELFTACERPFSGSNVADQDAAFIIPPGEASASGGSSPLDGVAAWALGHIGELVASQSWIGTMLCEDALGLSRRADLAGKGWQRLFASPETGPLACLAAARSLNPQGARDFAIKGLTRLSPEDFLNDCRPLLAGEGALPATLRTLLTRLASLNDSEVESLAAVLPTADADFLRQVIHILRRPGVIPSEAALAPALDSWWDTSVHARLSASLRHSLIMRPSDRSSR